MPTQTASLTLSLALFFAGAALLAALAAGLRAVLRARKRASRAWADMDALLHERSSLLAELGMRLSASDVSAAPAREQLARLRQRTQSAASRQERIVAEQEISRLLPGGIRQEQPPALADLERRIAEAREAYNAAAGDVNYLRRAFPALLVARALCPEDLPRFTSFDAGREP